MRTMIDLSEFQVPQENSEEELVLCIPSTGTLVEYEGFMSFQDMPYLFTWFLEMIKNNGAFLPRSEVENNEMFKQVVVYGVPQTKVNKNHFFYYTRRFSTQSEERLHNKIGFIGGHVNSEDFFSILPKKYEKNGSEVPKNSTNGFIPVMELIDTAMKREINEELVFKVETMYPIGLLNLYDTNVDRVHIGFVYSIKGMLIDVREKDKMEIVTVPYVELSKWKRDHDEELENWAKKVSSFIIKKVNAGVWY